MNSASYIIVTHDGRPLDAGIRPGDTPATVGPARERLHAAMENFSAGNQSGESRGEKQPVQRSPYVGLGRWLGLLCGNRATPAVAVRCATEPAFQLGEYGYFSVRCYLSEEQSPWCYGWLQTINSLSGMVKITWDHMCVESGIQARGHAGRDTHIHPRFEGHSTHVCCIT